MDSKWYLFFLFLLFFLVFKVIEANRFVNSQRALRSTVTVFWILLIKKAVRKPQRKWLH